MSDTPHIDRLFVRYENACARYWQNDLNPNISDRRLRELHDAMIVARRAMLDGIHAAPQAATGTVPPESSAPAVAAPHAHRCMSCGVRWYCPHPPGDCKADENVFPSLVLPGPGGPTVFHHGCQTKRPCVICDRT